MNKLMILGGYVDGETDEIYVSDELKINSDNEVNYKWRLFDNKLPFKSCGVICVVLSDWYILCYFRARSKCFCFDVENNKWLECDNVEFNFNDPRIVITKYRYAHFIAKSKHFKIHLSVLLPRNVYKILYL